MRITRKKKQNRKENIERGKLLRRYLEYRHSGTFGKNGWHDISWLIFWLWETGWDLCGIWGMFGPPKYTFDCPHILKSTLVILGQILHIKVAQQHRIEYVRYLFKFWYRVIWGLKTALNWQMKVFFVQEILYYACFVIPGHYGCPGGFLPKYSICRWN